MTISIFGTGVIDSEDARISLANTALVIPTGNTAQRPNPAIAGMLRFNNQSNVFEVYNGTSWSSIITTFIIEYLVVGGGGGSGLSTSGYSGGGGGGGGINSGTLNAIKDSQSIYNITIGAGGATASDGGNSIFSANISYGGGGGATGSSAVTYPSPARDGRPGGSGGGGSATGNASVGFTAGGVEVSGQGFSGGRGLFRAGSSPNLNAGGGGGGSQAGQDATPTVGGKGGDGRPSLITGANVFYGGGGGGASFAQTGGAGGAGGGGAGGGPYAGPAPVGQVGVVNTGGGAGAGGGAAGNTGGSGIVILAHSNVHSNGIVSAGLTYTTNTVSRPGFLVYTFTAGTGTIYWS